MTPETDPAALAEELAGPNPPRILDVREADELVHSRLEGVVHIPLGEVSGRLGELDPQADWVVVCRTGGRSGKVTDFLVGQGFRSVRNLVGGMNAWVRTVDPSMEEY